MQTKYIQLALKEANKASRQGEVPVGAVIVKNNKIISKAHNMVEKKKNCTQHAEIIAITQASKKIKNWRLNECEMYVTLEPCGMCREAIKNSRISKVYYILKKNQNNLNSKTKFTYLNIQTDDSLDIINTFFKKRR